MRIFARVAYDDSAGTERSSASAESYSERLQCSSTSLISRRVEAEEDEADEAEALNCAFASAMTLLASGSICSAEYTVASSRKIDRRSSSVSGNAPLAMLLLATPAPVRSSPFPLNLLPPGPIPAAPPPAAVLTPGSSMAATRTLRASSSCPLATSSLALTKW